MHLYLQMGFHSSSKRYVFTFRPVVNMYTASRWVPDDFLDRSVVSGKRFNNVHYWREFQQCSLSIAAQKLFTTHVAYNFKR